MPVEFQWASLGIGITALVVALWAVLRMIWGRPRLIAEFENDAQNQHRSLMVFLKNQPVGWPVKGLGVTRDTIKSLTASFRISEISRGTIIPVIQAQIYSDSDDNDKGRGRATLPPTYSVGASIVVASWDIDNQRVVVPPSRTRTETVLPEGDYEAAILFMVDGQDKTFARRFGVGQGADDLRWSTPR